MSAEEVEEYARGGVRSFVMMGGFGEEFVRPYSLMGCGYYFIQVDTQSQRIVSVERKMVY